jgi:hypothetical protein
VNTTLCQAGIGYYVYKQGSSIVRQIYPFVEWYPDGYETPPLANVPIRPGDSVTILLHGGSPQAPSGAGSTTASVVFINNTSGLMTSAMFSAPGPPVVPQQAKLLGTSAEWIVEANYNFLGATINTLPDYGQVFFSSCEAYMIKVPPSGQPYNVAVDAGTNSQGFTGTALNMVFGPNKDVPNQVVISECQLASPTIIQCSWSGQNLPENLR